MKNIRSDPPTVSMSMKRTINIQENSTSAAGTATLSAESLKTLIETQCFGGTTAFYRYVVNSITAWGQPGTPASISIEDSIYGIVSTDSGTYSARPAVGIFYPPSTRTVRSSSATGNIATLATAPDEAAFTVHYNITVWTVAKPDF
jgi:hypothetical protein